jgi:hypothetical protein
MCSVEALIEKDRKAYRFTTTSIDTKQAAMAANTMVILALRLIRAPLDFRFEQSWPTQHTASFLVKMPAGVRTGCDTTPFMPADIAPREPMVRV